MTRKSGFGLLHPMKMMDYIEESRDAGSEVAVTLAKKAGRLIIKAPKTALDAPVLVHVVQFDPKKTVKITKGENRGRTLSYSNIVTSWDTLRSWDGKTALNIATDKAHTSASLGMATSAVWDMIKNDPPLQAGFPSVPRVIAFGGGYPILEDGKVIGAIGVSGGHYSDDMEVARAGLAAIGAPVA